MSYVYVKVPADLNIENKGSAHAREGKHFVENFPQGKARFSPCARGKETFRKFFRNVQTIQPTRAG